MRLFFAVALPEPVRACLGAVQERLRAALGDAVRWSRADSLHITLKFLGDVQGAHAAQTVLEAVEPGLPPVGPLALELSNVGTFGGRRPRVVWAGVAGSGAPGLTQLAQHLDVALRPLGFVPDARPFSPHVTLGRVRTQGRRRGPGGDAIAAAVEASAVEPTPFRADEVLLYCSSYGARGGPVQYEAVGRLPLLGGEVA